MLNYKPGKNGKNYAYCPAIPTKSDLNKLHKKQRQKRLKNVWQLDGDEQDFCFYFYANKSQTKHIENLYRLSNVASATERKRCRW